MVDGAYAHAFLALLFTYFQAALKPLTLTFLFGCVLVICLFQLFAREKTIIFRLGINLSC